MAKERLVRQKFLFKPTIGTSDRILIAAAPRDGKTELAFKLLADLNPARVVLINPSPDKKYFERIGPARLDVDTTFPPVQHVAPLLQRDKRKYDALYWPILEEGNVYSVVDEWSALATENRYGDGLTYFVQMGRRRNCGHLGLTQKLVRIPTFLIDLADHIFVGGVGGNGIKKLESETEKPWEELVTNRQPYQWVYWSKNEPELPRYIN